MKSRARSEAVLSNLVSDNGSNQLDTRVMPITPFWYTCVKSFHGVSNNSRDK